MKIKNQLALICGGASGMGAETARYLRTLGAQVVILDRQVEAAEKVAQEIDALAIGCDITQEDSVTQAIVQIESILGIPRIYINCAGIAPAGRIVGKDKTPMPLADFTQVIQVNLIGSFNVMRVLAARMATLEPVGEDQERGVIINTASVAAFEGQIGQAAYSASKGGIVSMTLPAARELAHYGIRVLAIAPGLIATPLLYGLPEKVRDSLSATIPFPKRLGKPSEYARLAAHMIENTLLNGTVIRLDGALRMAQS